MDFLLGPHPTNAEVSWLVSPRYMVSICWVTGHLVSNLSNLCACLPQWLQFYFIYQLTSSFNIVSSFSTVLRSSLWESHWGRPDTHLVPGNVAWDTGPCWTDVATGRPLSVGQLQRELYMQCIKHAMTETFTWDSFPGIDLITFEIYRVMSVHIYTHTETS